MSLISEALKEAQRERSERSGQSGGPSAVDNFFPLPADRGRSRPSALFVGGIGVAAIVVASAVWWSTSHLFARARSSARIATSPLTVAQRKAAPAVTTVPPPARARDSVPSAGSPATPNRTAAKVVDAPRVVASVTPALPAPTSSRMRTPRTPAAHPSETTVDTAARLVSTAVVQPPSTGSNAAPDGSPSVRIIIDAPSVRPADSLFKLAYAEHLRGNFDRAKELYEQTIAMQQAPSEAYNDYGVLLSQHGNPTAAAEMFRVAVRRDDANAEAWINLGDSYNLAGHHADALSAFSRAIQLDPGNVAVKVRLAGEYHAIGDSVSARRLYDESLKTAPKDPAVHYELAKFLQAQQDYKGAAREFQQFVDLAGGKYDARTIEAVKQHVASLEKSAP